METKVKCPHCGTEFAIPAHQHVVTGMAIGKDSGLGTIFLTPASEAHPCDCETSAGRYAPAPLAGEENTGGCLHGAYPIGGSACRTSSKGSSARLEALRGKGIDTSKYFSLDNDKGEKVIMKWIDGIPFAVKDEELDELEKSIFENGYVKNTRLYRRWLLAQAMRMMAYKNGGFTEALHNHGYMYQWKMVTDELKVLANLERKDKECFDERSRWFTKDTVASMLADYLKEIEKHTKNLKTRKCKGVPYVHFNGSNIFVADLQTKVYNPIVNLIEKVNKARNYGELYNIVKSIRFYKLHWNTKQSPAFVDAYKGEGAFYAMKNLILFHGCKIADGGRILDKYESMAYINRKADEYADQGWRLFGVFKKLLTDNNFDFAKRMKELGVKGY